MTRPGSRAEAGLPRLGSSSLREQVATALEARILDGTFPADARLPTEHELQEAFGVSRTVVRDALRMLEVRGLVDIRRGLGTVVRSTSADAYTNAVATMLLRSDLTLGDVVRARAALESQLALVAARNHTPASMAAVERALDRFDALVQARAAVPGLVAAHVDLHTELLRATCLPALEILLRPIQEMMLASTVVAPGTDPRDPEGWRVDVHRAIVEAVAARDEAAVVAACERHWAAPLRGRRYERMRQVRLGEILVTPDELVAIPGGATADAA